MLELAVEELEVKVVSNHMNLIVSNNEIYRYSQLMMIHAV
jgi:hypothetical protein